MQIWHIVCFFFLSNVTLWDRLPSSLPAGLVPGHVGRVLLWLWAVTRGRLWDTDNVAYFRMCLRSTSSRFWSWYSAQGGRRRRTTGNPADSLHCTELDTRKCCMERCWYLLSSGSVSAFTNGPVLFVVLTLMLSSMLPGRVRNDSRAACDMTEVNRRSLLYYILFFPLLPTFKEVKRLSCSAVTSLCVRL